MTTFDTATRQDAEPIFNLINQAYVVEDGDSGVAFKAPGMSRLLSHFDSGMGESYDNGMVLKASIGDELVGVIVWSLTKSDETQEKPDCIHFGPFAVSPHHQGKGIGTEMIEKIEVIGLEHECKFVEISVVNWRTDLLPMYERKGFVKVGEDKFPDTERITRPCFMIIMRKPI